MTGAPVTPTEPRQAATVLLLRDGAPGLEVYLLRRTGKVGGSVDADAAAADAKVCALNALAAIDDLVGLDSIARIVRVVGYVASAEGFTGQPRVVNGASEFLGKIFGEAGQHARSAVGVPVLPLGAAVEIDAVVQVKAG